MMKRKHLALSFAVLLATGLSCDRPTAPPTTGSISIRLVTPNGNFVTVKLVASKGLAADVTPVVVPASNLTLDGVRVSVSGPTNKTVTVSTASGGFFNATVDNLDPGSYSVVVEGLVGGKVGHYGQTSNVNVTAGGSTPAQVTFNVFQPTIPNPTSTDTIDVLHFNVSFAAVPNATSYIVDWGTSSTLAGATSVPTNATSVDITVPAEGKYYFAVRAINSNVPAGEGLPSPVKSIYIFQGVATVAVTPATPSVVAGATQQFTAEARDADNNVVSNVTWFWSSSNHNIATVSQTGLVTTLVPGAVTITAIGKGTPGNATLTVNPQAASMLVFTSQPTNTVAGATMGSVQVAIQNAQGQTATGDNSTVITLAFGNNAGGGTLGGTKTATVTAGVAVFNTLNIDKSGVGYTLSATSNPVFTAATSSGFTIAAGSANKLAFRIQPSNTSAGNSISPAIQVEVQDANGNRVLTANNAVTLAIAANPGTGALSGTTTVNAIDGVATFSGVSVDKAGNGYTLSASATSLTTATSTAFNVLAATKLAFTIQPATAVAGDPLSPAIQVEVQDAAGNRITSARDAVQINFGNNAGGGTLTGTKVVNAINGIASFTGLWINKSANGYTLSASATGLTAATSSAFNITPGAPAKLAFSQQPTNAQGNVALANVTVTIADQFDNAVTTATNSVTMGINDNPWKTVFAAGASLAGTKTVAAVGGVATFSTLRVDKPSPGYTLRATSGSLTGSVSNTFNVNVTTTQLATGLWHTCTVATGGTYCFGYNGNGQLGVPPGTASMDSIATLTQTNQTFVAVTAGYYHSCGLTAAGAAYCWGYNGNGQLGNNSNTDSDTPVAVAGGHVFSTIEAGWYYTCGITTTGVGNEDRQVWCWGDNGSSQLGDSSTTQRLVPVKVKWPDALKQAGVDTVKLVGVTAGASHTCARTRENKGYCWGYNGNGQLGDGFQGTRNGPFQITTALVSTWSLLAAGPNHTCGTQAGTGKVYCWGYNGYGQLGDGSTTQRLAPVLTSNLGPWTSIAVGTYHSCGILSGAAYCWGYPYEGQLGNDNTNDVQTSPVAVAGGITTFQSIDAGYYFTCGRTAANTVYCWGNNGNGQLGSPGTNGRKTSPTQIVQ